MCVSIETEFLEIQLSVVFYFVPNDHGLRALTDAKRSI